MTAKPNSDFDILESRQDFSWYFHTALRKACVDSEAASIAHTVVYMITDEIGNESVRGFGFG